MSEQGRAVRYVREEDVRESRPSTKRSMQKEEGARWMDRVRLCDNDLHWYGLFYCVEFWLRQ